MIEPLPNSQKLLSDVSANTIKVGDITQIINYNAKPQALSFTIHDEDLPSIEAWQTRPLEQELVGYLQDPQIRLVGLYGAGGYGKSALAARIYSQQLGFDECLWAGFRQPVEFDVFGRWLLQKLVGLDVYIQRREVYEKMLSPELCATLLPELNRRRCLLVMDNLETLFQSGLWQPYGDFIAGWLGRGAKQQSATLLLTSQFKLDLPTAAWRWMAVGGLEIAQGVKLLVERGIQGEQADLEQFVSDAFGHPLLLQLAASWLRKGQLNDQEEPAVYRLQGQDLNLLRDIREQHRDVDTCVGEVLDRTFDQQSPLMQSLLQRLTVLRSSFSVAAAQAMTTEPVTVQDLRSLARWSWVQELKDTNKEWWFSFLPLITRYLQQKSSAEQIAGHVEAVQFYHDRKQPFSQNNDRRLESLVFFEHVEIVYHLCELGEYAAAWAEIFVGGRDSLNDFLQLRDFYDVRLSLCNQLATKWQPKDNDEKDQFATVLKTIGDVLQFKKQTDEALEKYSQALKMYEEVGDRLGAANTLKAIGDVLQFKKQTDEALEKYSQALKMYEEVGARLGAANTTQAVGHVYFQQEQLVPAMAQYQKALDLFITIQDRYSTGAAWIYIARTQAKQQNIPETKQAYQQAQKLFQEINLLEFVAFCEQKIAELDIE
jgi:tetratricopeptide (TPR) repeat protein